MGPLTKRTQGRDLRAFWLLAPTMAVLAVVIAYPVLRAVYLSFQDDAGLNEETGRFESGGFAGFKHYLMWLTGDCGTGAGSCPDGNLGSDFWQAVGITFFFAVITVAIEVVLGLWMATVMNRTFVGRSLLRASVLIPWAIPTAVTAKLWFFIFAENGIANKMLGTDIAWTTDPWASRFAVIIADVWKTTPFMALLILAGLQLIPSDVYEAARVDGATEREVFFKVVIPSIRATIVTVVTTTVIAALKVFDIVKAMTGGNFRTSTIANDVYNSYFIQSREHYGSALAVVLFILVIPVVIVNQRNQARAREIA